MNINKYIFGLDLGQQNDYTVLCAIETNLKNGELSYNLPFIYRFSLKVPYPNIVKSITTFITSQLELKEDYVLIIDYTGVGRPVVDSFKNNNLRIVSVNITGGTKSSWPSRVEANVPKRDIVSSIQVVMQNKRLKIASNLPLLEAFKKEFLGFKAKISSSGHDSYSAISGTHDDIVMSLGIALWYGEDRSRRGRKIRIISGN